MKLRNILLFVFLMFQFNSFCQEYIVAMEDRNKTIELTNQAIDCIKNNKTEDAFSLLVKAISIDSAFRNSFLYLFKVYIQDHDYSEKVVSYLKKAKRVFLEDDEISYYLGEIFRTNSEIKNAIQEYSCAIKYSKKNGEDFPLVKSYYFSRGNCYLKSNEIDSALVDYSYSIKLNPNQPSAFFNRGICFFKKGDTSKACEDWKASLILGGSQAKEYLEKYCIK